MSTSPLPTRTSVPRQTNAEPSAKKAADLESMAQIVEDLIPIFRNKDEKQFYREVVEGYRTAAQNIRKAWSSY